MYRVRLLLVSALAVPLVFTPGARACSIIAPERSALEQDVAAADAAIVGTVLEQEQLHEMLPTQTTVSVEVRVAGDVDEPVVVIRSDQQGGACGLEARPGTRVGLLLHRSPEGYWRSALYDMREPEWLLELAGTRSGWFGLALANLKTMLRRWTHPAFVIEDDRVRIGDGPIRHVGQLIGTRTARGWEWELCAEVFTREPPTCGDHGRELVGFRADPLTIPSVELAGTDVAWARLPADVRGTQLRSCVDRPRAQPCDLFVRS